MVFPRRLLFEGEDVVVELRPHWIFLGWPLVVTVLAVAFAVSIVASFPKAPIGVSYVLGAVVLVPGIWLVGRVARWWSMEVVVTTNRIIERWGVLSRRSDEIRLEAVNQLSYHQNLFDRLLRVGNVYIEVPGRTGVVVYQCLRRPDVVQRIISEQTAALYGQGAAGGPAAGYGASRGAAPAADFHHTPPAGTAAVGTPPSTTGGPVAAGATGAAGSVVDAMAQLDELRRRGLLSEAEYEGKRAELLRRL
jgi:hypothetical protein